MKKFELIITDSYLKKEKHFLKSHRDLADVYTKVLSIMSENPFHPSLRLHKLQGTLACYHSISINMKYRIIIDFIIDDNKTIPLDVGDHDIYK